MIDHLHKPARSSGHGGSEGKKDCPGCIAMNIWGRETIWGYPTQFRGHGVTPKLGLQQAKSSRRDVVEDIVVGRRVMVTLSRTDRR